MIRAAVNYADGKGAPPPELSRYLKWKTWNVLPLSGGTDEQRFGELERMLACANAFEIWKLYQHGNLSQMNKEQLLLLKQIKDLMNG